MKLIFNSGHSASAVPEWNDQLGGEQSPCRDRVLQLLLRQPVETALPSLNLRPEITVELHGQATTALPMRRIGAPMHYVKSPPLGKTQSALSGYCHGMRQITQHGGGIRYLQR